MLKFKDWAKSTTLSKIIPKAISYDIICAADLKAPKKAYFELLDHPAMIIECTLRDDKARR